MIRASLLASVVSLLALWPGSVQAQYGYPGGYGGYGWGGWGSTVQGSIAGSGLFQYGPWCLQLRYSRGPVDQCEHRDAME